MKILVADDDHVSRKLVTAFLGKADYEVVAVDNGPDAVAAMNAAEAPQIAILDWVMPGMTGPEVCAKVREFHARIRPHIIMLSAKTDKSAIADGLDAGADDFLSKPFNPTEMLARVRVGERTIQREIELQQHIGDLEALAQRYNLLGEIIGRRGTDTPGAAHPDSRPLPSEIAASRRSTTLTSTEIDAVAIRAFHEIGLDGAQPTSGGRPDTSAPCFVAWAGIILANERVWMDMLLELDVPSASAVYEKALKRRAASDQEIRRLLAETHTIIHAAFKAELQTRGADILTPALSRAIRRDAGARELPLPEEGATRNYSIGGAHVSLTVTRQPSPIEHKSPRQLRATQILADEYPPPEVEAFPLVNRGVVLNERYIGKLIAYAQRESASTLVPVFVPSPIAGFF